MDADETKKALQEMGFSEDQIQKAINSTNSTNIEVLITFLENQQEGGVGLPQGEGQPAQQQPMEGQSISALVNQEDVALLISLGFSKNVAEKSLLFSENKGVEAAKAWIEEHKKDTDFEEEVRIVQEKKLTPEEAQFRARELQQKLREKRKKQEEETALELERNRIKFGKQMLDTKRELEEIKRRQEMDQAKRERLQFLKDKEQMEEQLRRERLERAGKKYEPNQKQQEQQKQLSPLEAFDVGIKQIKVAQPPNLIPDVAFNSLSLISKILENIIKNPDEQKFRKISLTSQAFTNKIENVFGARNALDALGFVEQEGNYVYPGQDIDLLKKALVKSQEELKTL